MPPRDVSEETTTAVNQQQPATAASDEPFVPTKVNVAAIRKSLPPHLFEKDLYRSLFYFAVDTIVLATCFRSYSPDMSWPTYILFANITGLFMWNLFVVGHDAGHGTFSDNKVINGVFGHLAHGFLLVPFWPWARSHAAHHAFHQHKTKDRGHVWAVKGEEGLGGRILKDYPFFIPITYGIGYLLVGIDDGSHYFPWSKLHKTTRDRVDCTISALVCVVFGVTIYTALQSSFWAAYFVPWLIYNT
ncbi:hypothetical protein HDU67_004206, partial [Dinochytrium kinnereticum]